MIPTDIAWIGSDNKRFTHFFQKHLKRTSFFSNCSVYTQTLSFLWWFWHQYNYEAVHHLTLTSNWNFTVWRQSRWFTYTLDLHLYLELINWCAKCKRLNDILHALNAQIHCLNWFITYNVHFWTETQILLNTYNYHCFFCEVDFFHRIICMASVNDIY